MKLKENIAFIGVGQCGNNIAHLFELDGFTTLHINTSELDVKTLKDVTNFWHLKDGIGVAKDRTKARQLFSLDKSGLQYVDAIKENIIFVCFSSGGGTGSSLAPIIISYLAKKNKNITICPVVVTPDDDESLQVKINTCQLLNELKLLKGIGATFVIDNNKDEKQKLNRLFQKNLYSFLKVPENINHGAVIDYSELERMLATSGIATIFAKKEKTSVDEVLANLKDGPIFISSENDKKLVYACIKSNLANLSKSIKQEIGVARDTFSAHSDTETVVALFGQSFPESRAKQIQQSADELAEIFSRNYVVPPNRLEIFDPFAEFDKKQKESESKREDLFADFF